MQLPLVMRSLNSQPVTQAWQQSLLSSQGAAEAGAAWGALQGTEAALRAQYGGLLPGDALLGSQVRQPCFGEVTTLKPCTECRQRCRSVQQHLLLCAGAVWQALHHTDPLSSKRAAQMGSGQLGRLGRTMSAGAQQQLLQQRLAGAPRASHSGPLLPGQVSSLPVNCYLLWRACNPPSLSNRSNTDSVSQQFAARKSGQKLSSPILRLGCSTKAACLPVQQQPAQSHTACGVRDGPCTFRASARSLQHLQSLRRGQPDLPANQATLASATRLSAQP